MRISYKSVITFSLSFGADLSMPQIFSVSVHGALLCSRILFRPILQVIRVTG